MSLTKEDNEEIDGIVQTYTQKKDSIFEVVRQQMVSSIDSHPELRNHIHSIKSRLKDPEHLREKLCRKLTKCRVENSNFEISADNLFLKINDLIGIRLIHLHTSQFSEIDKYLREVCDEWKYEIFEEPIAKIWDYDYEEKFRAMGVKTERNERMYTSVHYVISNNSKTQVTCEIQVRTLMEEVWGEVDHKINYPKPSDSIPCKEQIFALARVTSGATRLVDSIFASHEDHIEKSKDS